MSRFLTSHAQRLKPAKCELSELNLWPVAANQQLSTGSKLTDLLWGRTWGLWPMCLPQIWYSTISHGQVSLAGCMMMWWFKTASKKQTKKLVSERSREMTRCHRRVFQIVCIFWVNRKRTPFLFDCPAYSHIRQQYSHLFHQASSSVATFLATDQSNVVGSYLKTCFAQRQTVLASPLLAWLLNFIELD